MALPREALKAMDDKDRRSMSRDFSWDCVVRDMLDVYLWLARNAAPPPTIRFS
jgi:hypothetical protein